MPGDYTVFERNPDYWEKGLPVVDELIFKVIKDAPSRIAALRKGVVDIGWMKDAAIADMARKEKSLQVITPPPCRQMWMFMTHDRFPFNNKKLRQAVSACIDREAIIKTVYMGFAELTSCIPPSAVPFALSEEEVRKLPFHKRDLKLARQLLKEAGYPDGFEFTLVTSNHSPDYIPGAQMIQSNCKDVGIKVNIETVEWGIQLNRWKSSDFQAWGAAGHWYPFVEGYVATWLQSKSKRNYGLYKNPKLDRLLHENSVTVDLKRRKEIWREIQYMVAEDVPILFPAAGPPRFEIVSSYVKDYHFLSNTSRTYLRQAWLDK